LPANTGAALLDHSIEAKLWTIRFAGLCWTMLQASAV